MRFRLPSHPAGSTGPGDSTHDPNAWFAARFPLQAERYGAAFLEGTFSDPDGLTRWVPSYLNEDFFAALLGGDPRLGHQVVFYPPEERWYFFDYRVEAFCPTTPAKLKLLLSNWLLRCSQQCQPLVDITNLVVRFRQDPVLEGIVGKARAMLEAERTFFEGREGQRRCVDGRFIEANEEPGYRRFVKAAIVRAPEGKVTVADAFHRYYAFCRSQGQAPLTRQEFKQLVAEVIREEFDVGLRHDVLTGAGKQGHGWHGVRLNLEAVHGRN